MKNKQLLIGIALGAVAGLTITKLIKKETVSNFLGKGHLLGRGKKIERRSGRVVNSVTGERMCECFDRSGNSKGYATTSCC